MSRKPKRLQFCQIFPGLMEENFRGGGGCGWGALDGGGRGRGGGGMCRRGDQAEIRDGTVSTIRRRQN